MTTVPKTLAAIVQRSCGVRWQSRSDGLSLIREREGYVLVSCVKAGDEVLGEPVVVESENGGRMKEGHWLTEVERERAVRSILGL